MRTSQRKIRTSTASARILQQNRNCRCALWVRRQFHFAGPVAGVSSQGRKKPQRATVAVFCGPDTRQRLLPLLPFGPDGVGSDAAARPAKCFTCKDVGCQCPASVVPFARSAVVSLFRQSSDKAILFYPAAPMRAFSLSSRPGRAVALLNILSIMLSLRPPIC